MSDELYNVLMFKDANGKVKSILIENEEYVILNNKILLNYIPDRNNKVIIDGMYEVKQGQRIADNTQFKVDYSNGEVTFHADKNETTIIVTKYYGIGVIKIYASRVIDNTGDSIDTSKSLQDYIDSVRPFGYKGDYSAETTYEPSSIVAYDYGIYRCKQTSIGILPTNTDNWEVMFTVKSEAEYAKAQGDYAKASADGILLISEDFTPETITVNNDIAPLVKDELDRIDSQLADMNTNKVDKISGKGLSTNDYTNNDKAEVAKVVNKADKAYVDTQISNIGNSSPKGTYATLTALQSAFPTGTTGIYTVTADGGWYYWNGTAWTKGGTYQSSGIADKSILPKHMSFDAVFGQKSLNLFDISISLADKYLTPTSGVIASSPGFTASDFIEATPNTTYIASSTIWRFAEYDANKAWISSSNVGVTTITTSATTAYIRVTVNQPSTNVPTFMVCKGSVLPTTYIAYGNNIKDKSITTNMFTDPLKKRVGCPDFAILLPSDIYLVSGESFSIYYKNIVKYSQAFLNGNYYMVALEKSGATYKNRGLTYEYKWEYTPLSTDTTFQMEFRIVATFDEEVLTSKIVTFHVANSSNVANRNRTGNIIVIGDSFEDGYHVVDKLYNNLTTKGGANNPTFLGQNLSTGSTVRHDAWAGWRYQDFYNAQKGLLLRPERPLTDAIWDAGWGENETYGWTTGQTYNDLTATQRSHGFTKNQFYNPSTSMFDFSYYMNKYYPTYKARSDGSPHVNTVALMCGINDLGWTLVQSVPGQLSFVSSKITALINSIHAFDTAIKIFLYTVVPQMSDQNQIGSIFTTFSHYERINYCLQLYNEMIINTYDTSEMKAANVYVLPSNANFDTRFGIETASTFKPNKFDQTYTETHATNIHPSNTGSEYIADTVYQAIYNLGLD